MLKFFFCLFLISFLSSGCQKAPSVQKVCVKNTCVEVELAQTPQQWERGLQGRVALGKNQGMLFIFPWETKHIFWMKNTKIPLDIIWINSQRKIIFIKESAFPCREDPCPTFGPVEPSSYVLEVPAGFVKAHRIKKGDEVTFYLP